MHMLQIVLCSQLEDKLQCLLLDSPSRCNVNNLNYIKEDSMLHNHNLTDNQEVVFNSQSIINKILFMEMAQVVNLHISSNNNNKHLRLHKAMPKEEREVNFIELKNIAKL